MIIGVDFDNTIISYSKLFHSVAVELGYISLAHPSNKKSIRDTIWTIENGKTKWTELQAEVYGRRILEADLYPGVKEFFQNNQNVQLYIISHKTEFSAIGLVNLREAALQFMTENNFFDTIGFALKEDQIFFCPTREDKISTLIDLGCTHFIDDLEEMFENENFPNRVKKYLFKPEGESSLLGVTVIRSWKEMTRALK